MLTKLFLIEWNCKWRKAVKNHEELTKKGTKFAYGRVYNEFWMEVRMKGWMSNRIIKEHTEWNLIKIVKKKGVNENLLRLFQIITKINLEINSMNKL